MSQDSEKNTVLFDILQKLKQFEQLKILAGDGELNQSVVIRYSIFIGTNDILRNRAVLCGQDATFGKFIRQVVGFAKITVDRDDRVESNVD